MSRPKKEVAAVKEETAQQLPVNNTVTDEQFANSNILDILAINNELNSLNQGELTLKVAKKDYFSFAKTDKDDNRIPLLNDDGSQTTNENGELQYEMIHSPYVEIVGSGIKGRITTKQLNKDEIESLETGETYVAKYILTADDSLAFKLSFVSVVPLNQELHSRVNNLPKVG